MTLLEETIASIPDVDAAIGRRTQSLFDGKTKPRRSLGRLEDLGCAYAAMRGDPLPPPPDKAILVMAADHGVAAEGVSAYPQEVTRQMLHNFAAGGAAINVLARRAGARLVVVDMGVAGDGSPPDGVRDHRVAPGTASFVRGPAMSAAQTRAALETGIRLARELAASGVTLLGLGEMGIGNSTAASALVAALTGAPPEAVTGRGTGIDDDRWRRKVDVVRRALAVHAPRPEDPLDVLARLGGFEIAGLAGAVLGAAAARVPVLVDGLIVGAAALAATRIAPRARAFLLASHRSVEPGHAHALGALDLAPLLDLGLRLGEGTGAALAIGLVDAALALLGEMASFGDAGVSDAGA